MVPEPPAGPPPGPPAPPRTEAVPPPVAVLRWPDDADLRPALVADGRPRLLVLEPGAAPPLVWDDLEDWIRVTAGPTEVAARSARLEGRAEPAMVVPAMPLPLLDGDGTLRAADGRVLALGPVDARLVHVLLERCDEVVRRPELKRAGWPARAVTDRAVDGRICRLRGRLPGVGLRIATIRGVGYLLERVRPY